MRAANRDYKIIIIDHFQLMYSMPKARSAENYQLVILLIHVESGVILVIDIFL